MHLNLEKNGIKFWNIRKMLENIKTPVTQQPGRFPRIAGNDQKIHKRDQTLNQTKKTSSNFVWEKSHFKRQPE